MTAAAAARAPTLLDAAMGTALFAAGWPRDRDTGLANTEAPELVERVHAAHLAAGARVIGTNTFGAGLAAALDVGLVAEAVAIARRAVRESGTSARVAGTLAAAGAASHPGFPPALAALADTDVDLLVLETVVEPDDAHAALEACARIARRLPVVLCASTARRAQSGERERLAAIGAAALAAGATFGLNCCRGPADVLAHVLGLEPRPTWLKPSAGVPPAHAEASELEAFARAARDLGARFVGGCCGVDARGLAALAAGLAPD